MQEFLKKELNINVSTTVIYRFFKRKKLIRKPQRRLPWYEPMKEKLSVIKPGVGVQIDVKYVYQSKNAIVAFLNAQNYFSFPITSVQTDNGSEFRGCFHDWLTRRNIRHYFIPKKSPWWNAQVERVHKTIDDEYYQNPFRIWKSPLDWLDFYNHDRIHTTLKGLTPAEYYQKSVTIEC